MNKRRFLKSRLPVLAAFAASAALTALYLTWRGVESADVAYVCVLIAFFASVCLAADYIRHAPLYKEFRGRTGALDDALLIQSPVTAEEAELVRLLHDGHRAFVSELAEARRNYERHLEYVRLWIHQMKTPLSVISLSLEQTPDWARPEETAAWIDSLREETERLAEGLDTMLHAARLGRPETDLAVRRTDLVALARECIADRKTAFIRAGIAPRLEAEAPRIEAETDAKWIKFVIHQLLSNAIKYSALSGRTRPVVRVAVAREPSGARLTVADEGIGIPPEDVPRVFEPFFTGENGRKTREATGMGLYLVKQVLDRLGHRIELVSRPGEGTTVTVRFETRSIVLSADLSRGGHDADHSASSAHLARL